MHDTNDSVKMIQQAKELHSQIRKEISRAVVGQDDIVEALIVCLLSGGHALLVGVPGLAKTLLVRSIAQATQLSFSRIQFTPDLMPADITGTTIIEEDAATGHRDFSFRPGPLFAQIVLADEINRTPPKTQAALLESMQEHSVTIGRNTYPLEEPFFVLATQNPIEQEGTYPLPEAQLDRFMMNLLLDYPSAQEEVEILRTTTGGRTDPIQPVVTGPELVAMQAAIRQIPCADEVFQRVVALVQSTRPSQASSPDVVKRFVRWGAGPRASQNIIFAAKARAALHGRFNVEMEDVTCLAKPVLRHRILLNYRAEAEGLNSDAVVDAILN